MRVARHRSGKGGVMALRFKDPRDHWPVAGDAVPDGPEGSAIATLQRYVPSLSPERRREIARAMRGMNHSKAAFGRILLQEAPELCEEEEGE